MKNDVNIFINSARITAPSTRPRPPSRKESLKNPLTISEANLHLASVLPKDAQVPSGNASKFPYQLSLCKIPVPRPACQGMLGARVEGLGLSPKLAKVEVSGLGLSPKLPWQEMLAKTPHDENWPSFAMPRFSVDGPGPLSFRGWEPRGCNAA
jgi:hypothetical protein